MKIIIGGMWHETNTFASDKTRFEDFEILKHQSIIERATGTKTEIGGMIEKAEEKGIKLIPTFHAKCIPSGTVTKEAFEKMSANLLAEIEKVKDFDGVLLRLHGAMVAQGHLDPEGELLEKVRELVGDKPIVATMDLHANISELMAEKADVLIGYDTYPHVDFFERGYEAVDVIHKILSGEYKPTAYLKETPLMPPAQALFTSQEPMKSLFTKVHKMEERKDVVSITVGGGFCYADVPFAGINILVTTNNNEELAEQLADELYQFLMDRKDKLVVKQKSVADGVKEADFAKEGPVIIVDGADNIGGGAPGDGTTVLNVLKEQNTGPAVMCLADKESVYKAIQAGIGETVQLTVGAKTDDLHGKPVEIKGVVSLISTGDFRYKGSYMKGEIVKRGLTVVIKSKLLTLVLSENKVMPFDQEELRSLGIDPLDYKIIVVKSAIAWRAAYGSLAKQIIEVDTPGICAANLARFEYKNVRRPVFPLDEI